MRIGLLLWTSDIRSMPDSPSLYNLNCEIYASAD